MTIEQTVRTEAGRRLVAKVMASRRMRLYGRAAIEADVRAIEDESSSAETRPLNCCGSTGGHLATCITLR